jgi:hypothetical protein
VVQAIFALSSEERVPEAIWEMPSADEWQKVAYLVAEYLDDGDFAGDGDRYAWDSFVSFRLRPTRQEH